MLTVRDLVVEVGAKRIVDGVNELNRPSAVRTKSGYSVIDTFLMAGAVVHWLPKARAAAYSGVPSPRRELPKTAMTPFGAARPRMISPQYASSATSAGVALRPEAT